MWQNILEWTEYLAQWIRMKLALNEHQLFCKAKPWKTGTLEPLGILYGNQYILYWWWAKPSWFDQTRCKFVDTLLLHQAFEAVWVFLFLEWQLKLIFISCRELRELAIQHSIEKLFQHQINSLVEPRMIWLFAGSY